MVRALYAVMFIALAMAAWVMPEHMAGFIVIAIYFGASLIADEIKEQGKKKQG